MAVLTGALAGDGDVDAVIAEDALQQPDIGEARDAVERQGLVGEERGDHQGERRILGAADRNGAVKRVAASDPDTIHLVRFPLKFPQK
jgi:hypothetical protein